MMFNNKLFAVLVFLIGCGLICGCGNSGKEKSAQEAQPTQQSVVQNPPAGGKDGAMPCYEVGLRTGRCAAKMMSGLPCEPADEIPVPPSCKDTPDMEKGLSDGRKSVY